MASVQLKSNCLDNWSQFLKALPKIDSSSDDDADVTKATKTKARQTALRRYHERIKGHGHGHHYTRAQWHIYRKKLMQWKLDIALMTATVRQLCRQRLGKTRNVDKVNRRYKMKATQLRKFREQVRRSYKNVYAARMQMDLAERGK